MGAPIPKPEVGRPVLATCQHFHTKGTQQAVLVAVEESDVDYRFEDDNSELSYDWSVIAWEYVEGK